MKLKKTKDSIKVEAPKGYHWMTESGRHFLMKGDYKPHEGASASAPFRIVTHDKTMKADMGMKIEAIKTAKKYKNGGSVKKKSPIAKRYGDGHSRKNIDGSTSSHLMASAEADGKFYAFPTLFPNPMSKKSSQNPKDWYEPKDPFSYAKRVGELYEFDTEKEAQQWAEGGYKKQYKKGGKVKSKVNQAGNYTQPGMRKRLFNRIMAGSKGGNPGQWSARKAQMLAKAYKAAGGGYKN